jgi:deoxyribose-phosphate aldolase
MSTPGTGGGQLPHDAAALARLLDEVPRPDDAEVARRAAALAVPDDALCTAAISVLDLTSLDATDTPDRVRELARRAAAPGAGAPPVAAVCVWPDLVGAAREELVGTGVRVASVAGAFPSGRSALTVRVAEVQAAVAAGADEIDVVIDRAALADGREWEACQQIAALRAAGGGATCKVILETGALPDATAVVRAAWVAMLAGADMLKTSTGKDGPGADATSVLLLVEQARAFEERFGRPVGVKASGGIRSADDATRLLTLVREAASADWLSPGRLRLGASSLLDALLERLARGNGPGG